MNAVAVALNRIALKVDHGLVRIRGEPDGLLAVEAVIGH